MGIADYSEGFARPLNATAARGGKRAGAGRKPSEKTLFERSFVGPQAPRMNKSYCPHEKPLLKNGKARKFCFECQPRKQKEGPRKKYEYRDAGELACRVCGNVFVPSSYQQKYCNDTCRHRANNTSQRRKEKLAEKYRHDNRRILRIRLRSRIAKAMKGAGFKKSKRTEQMLGCDFQTFKRHIERQFAKGMSWENRSEWHIDHIVPLASAKDADEMERLNHFTNLRPMWAADNLVKGARLVVLL